VKEKKKEKKDNESPAKQEYNLSPISDPSSKIVII
jgi:hypothetical protein